MRNKYQTSDKLPTNWYLRQKELTRLSKRVFWVFNPSMDLTNDNKGVYNAGRRAIKKAIKDRKEAKRKRMVALKYD